MRPATYPPTRYEMATAARIGTVEAYPRVAYRLVSRTPTIGVRIAATPTVASHPSRIAPHDVAVGRTTTSRAIPSPPYEVSCPIMQARGQRLDGRCPAPAAAGERLGEVGLLPRQVQIGRRVAAVRVDDDLAASEAGVPHRPADHELPGAVDDVPGVAIEQVRRDRRPHDGLPHISTEPRHVDVLVVLRRHHHGVHPLRPPL